MRSSEPNIQLPQNIPGKTPKKAAPGMFFYNKNLSNAQLAQAEMAKMRKNRV